ncbi:MAG: DUF6531 domain-containing protein [Kiritimatiellae bacterium]|nr:DUF6531 domain-containing protein [Kiritimatiellia bacterium]
MKKQMLKKGHVEWRALALCLAACILTAAFVRAVLPEGRSVDIHLDGGDVSLTLPGIKEATYDIQVKNTLTNTWSSLGTVIGLDGITTVPVTPDSSPSRFFRVLFPQPTISAGEPALLANSGGSTLYVTGRFFYAGDQIFVDGVLLENATFLGSSLLSGTLPNLAPGAHTVEVVSSHSGLVLATLNNALEVAPSLARTLQAPPEGPPASPARTATLVAAHACTAGQSAGAGQQTRKSDPPSGLATGKRLHKPMTITIDGGGGSAGSVSASDNDVKSGNAAGKRDPASGLPTGRRMHLPMTPNGGGSPNPSYDLQDSDDDGGSALSLRLHSGEVEQQVVDLAIPGRGLDFLWVRTYRSRTGAATVQGNRWSHSYDVRCVQNNNAIDIYDGTGRRDTFRLQANGAYTCPEFFREGRLDGATAAFRLTFADTGYWEFNPFDAASAAGGKLARIVDRHGNTVTLNYDGDGQLIAIVDDLGRTNTIAYNPAAQIASVSDFSGRTVTYAYYAADDPNGLPGDLKSMTSPAVTKTSNNNDFPFGKSTTYTYSTGPAPEVSGLLLSMVDARGQTTAQCAYDLDPTSPTFAQCVSVQRGTDAPTCITYLPQTPVPGNRFAALRCIVNDPLGNVSEYDFDSRNRPVALREFTGRAAPGQAVTATANRPAGKLRATDPDLFESAWSWNNDSLCTSWQRPLTNRIEWVYQGDLNHATPPRLRGNLRTERCVSNGDLDGDGRADFLVSSFEHDPRFGSDPSSNFTAEFRDGHYILRSGARSKPWLCSNFRLRLSFAGGVDQNCDGRDDDCDGFVTRVTNPRGFETRCNYDANGNLVTLTQHGVILDRTPPTLARANFEYNAHGQLTACVQAEDGAGHRRRDEYIYFASGAQRGYLQQVVVDADAAGDNLTTSYEYDARGNLIRCVDPRGTPTEFEVNALNQIVSKQTQGATFGEKVRAGLFYDANNNLVQVDVENRAPDGTLDLTNPDWTTTVAYDLLNRAIQVAQEVSQGGHSGIMTNQFVYDANGGLILHRLPEGVSGVDPDNVISYALDERGFLYTRACAPGTGLSTVDLYDYDSNGNIRKISQVDVSTVSETVCVYDGFDRPIQTIDAMGNVATCIYDACGNRIYTRTEGELVDLPGGALNRTLTESFFTYDPLNRLTGRSNSFFDLATGTLISDGASQFDWSYAPNNQLLTCTDDRGHTTSFNYDSVGRLASVVDPKGNTTACAYDGNGNILTVQTTDLSDVSAGRQLFTQSFAYDALDRCISVTDNVGNTISNAYDSSHNLISTTDALGNGSVFTVDGLGRVTNTTHYSGAQAGGIVLTASHSEYRNNRIVSSTDGNGNTTMFTYDSCDRPVSVTHADGTVIVRGWDPRSRLAQYTDANGTTVTNTYDALDRLVRRDITVAPGVMDTTTFETLAYDGLGQLVAAANNGSALSFAYDSLGNRIRCVQDGMAMTNTYDGVGNRLALSCPDGREVLWSYDALDLPTAVSTRETAAESLTTLGTLAYDGPGRLAKIVRANQINTRVFWNGEQNTPNAANDFGWQQVARINHARAGGGKVVDQRNSAYDRNQNQTLRVMTAPWSGDGPLREESYAYDALHRLTRGTHSNRPAGDRIQSYVLDPNGNRLQVTNNGVAEAYAMNAAIPPGDAQMNQYTEAPSGTFSYDANGNRIASTGAAGERVYHYDYANRLVQVDEQVAGGAPSTVVTYRYSPLAVGHRLGKTTPLLLPDGPVQITTTYLYDYGVDNDCDGVDDDCDSPTGGNLLQTYVDGAAQRTFVRPHLLEKSGALASISGGAILFHHYDDQGGLLALTDAKGDVVERFEYEDYGAPLFYDASGTPRPDATAPITDELQLFSGMTWNAETGLYGGGNAPSPYMNKGELIDAIAKGPNFSACRYFDPETGRTLSRGDAEDNPGSISSLEWQDHNSSRSNKSNSIFDFAGGGSSGGGSGGRVIDNSTPKKVAKFKAGKALADVVK